MRGPYAVAAFGLKRRSRPFAPLPKDERSFCMSLVDPLADGVEGHMIWTRIAEAFDDAAASGIVVGPDHADYEKLRRVWNGVADRRPAAIVRARNSADVSKTIRVAAEQGSLLAVRSGGHSLAGLSTCDGGIVLDISAMKSVVVDRLARIAEVGGGALLGDLDAAGFSAGLVTPAGIVSHTGVAGLTLGGGMGWLSRRFGLTIDSLLSAEIVTADGRLIETSPEIEPELFWGIRGGGGNFGVVTKFRFRMHPLGAVLVGRWNYPRAACEAALKNYGELAAKAPRELATAFTLTASGLSLTVLWSGPAEGALKAIEPYGALAEPESGAIGGQTFLELQSRNDAHFAWGRRCYAKGGFLQSIDNRAITCLLDSIADAPTPDSELYVLQLGGAIADVDENATAYTGRQAGFYWVAEPVWDSAADDAHCIAWGRQAAARMTAISQAGNYVNEQADVGKDVAYSAYGAEKYRRLAKLKGRFDPANVFRLNQNIEPEV
jgi:FAD/FMN-containing dehydrogenase